MHGGQPRSKDEETVGRKEMAAARLEMKTRRINNENGCDIVPDSQQKLEHAH